MLFPSPSTLLPRYNMPSEPDIFPNLACPSLDFFGAEFVLPPELESLFPREPSSFELPHPNQDESMTPELLAAFEQFIAEPHPESPRMNDTIDVTFLEYVPNATANCNVSVWPTKKSASQNQKNPAQSLLTINSNQITLHQRKRLYVECLEEYVQYLLQVCAEHRINPVQWNRVDHYPGLSTASLRTIFMYFANEARCLERLALQEELRADQLDVRLKMLEAGKNGPIEIEDDEYTLPFTSTAH
ncbi:hypothetical protein C8F01DRAFT_1244644 [Mycena amicta]|nr:hypothetical protein C8F01DRAFT_1244644 [Mycena amicta]